MFHKNVYRGFKIDGQYESNRSYEIYKILAQYLQNYDYWAIKRVGVSTTLLFYL